MAPPTTRNTLATSSCCLPTEKPTAKRSPPVLSSTMLDDNDEDEGTPTPMLDRFFNSHGAVGILTMTDFSYNELNRLWDRVSGEGRVLRVARDAQERRRLGPESHIFRLKAPSYQKMIAGFLRVVGLKLYDGQVVSEAASLSMKRLFVSGRAFAHFPYAMYAVDATFQQGNRPSSNMAEGKTYFSGKHKLYGLKVEVSVNSLRLAVNCSDHVPGSVADIQLFRQNIAFQQQQRAKSTEEDRSLEDNGPLQDEYPLEWTMVADKGYQGLAHYMRVIHFKKAEPNERLSFQDERLNRRISSDRIIVEIFFGILFVKTMGNSTIKPRTGFATSEWYCSEGRLSQEKYRARKRIRNELTIDDLPGRG